MNILNKIYILFFFSLLGGLCAQTVFVSSQHRIYDYLERMETKGLLRGFRNNTRPLTRLEIAKALRIIHKAPESLNQTEQQEFFYLVSFFREELEELYKPHAGRIDKVTGYGWVGSWLPDQVYANDRNLFYYEDKTVQFNIDPILSMKRLYAGADTLSSQERVFENTSGFLIWGTLGKHVGFYTDTRDTREWGTRTYSGMINQTGYGLGFVSRGDGQIYHDETRAYLVFNRNWFLCQFGKDENQWGPGYRGQLALSDESTSYDFFKLQVNTRPFKLTSMYAVLKHFTPEYFYGNHQEKYLASHRIEFSPLSWINLGLHEFVIFSDRKFESAYINPVMFLRSAEHYLGDRDNAAMGLDIELFLLPRTKLYGELYLDDITTGKLGTSYYGNKYAYLGGFYHIDPFGIDNTDIRVEYAKLRPFVYSHKTDINTFNHFITGMGYWSGPNSDVVYVELNYRPTFRTRLTCFGEKLRHGANTDILNVGGNIFIPHTSEESTLAPFLNGVLEQTLRFGLKYRYELFHECFISAQYSYGNGTSKWNSNNSWPGKRSEFWFQTSLNY